MLVELFYNDTNTDHTRLGKDVAWKDAASAFGALCNMSDPRH